MKALFYLTILLAAFSPAPARAQLDPSSVGFYRRMADIIDVVNIEAEREKREKEAAAAARHEEAEIRRQQEEIKRNPGSFPRQRLSNEARLANNPWAKAADMTIRVEVFVADDCRQCTMMEEYLSDIGVPYTLQVLRPGTEAEGVYLAQIGRGVIPVTRVNGRIIRGYDPEQVRRVILEEKDRVTTR